MTSIRAIVAVFGLLLVGLTASGQDLPGRTELKRADLAVSNDMEVINSLLVLRPGDQVPLHSHHGVEAAYVVEGGMIQRNGKPPSPCPLAPQSSTPATSCTEVSGWSVTRRSSSPPCTLWTKASHCSNT